MFFKKVSEYRKVIDDRLDCCVNRGIMSYADLGSEDQDMLEELMLSVAAEDCQDSVVSLAAIAGNMFKLEFRSGEEREGVEDLVKNFIEALYDVPEIEIKIDELIMKKWADLDDDYPEKKPRPHVLDLIDQDNLDRARACR